MAGVISWWCDCNEEIRDCVLPWHFLQSSHLVLDTCLYHQTSPPPPLSPSGSYRLGACSDSRRFWQKTPHYDLPFRQLDGHLPVPREIRNHLLSRSFSSSLFLKTGLRQPPPLFPGASFWSSWVAASSHPSDPRDQSSSVTFPWNLAFLLPVLSSVHIVEVRMPPHSRLTREDLVVDALVVLRSPPGTVHFRQGLCLS